jgi:hypothetical protein
MTYEGLPQVTCRRSISVLGLRTRHLMGEEPDPCIQGGPPSLQARSVRHEGQSNFSLPSLLLSLLGAVILLAIVNLVRRGAVR